LKRHGIKPAFIWVKERVSGVGSHTHAILHLGPTPKEIAKSLQKFGFGPQGIHFSYGKYGARTIKMQAGLLRYLAKGMDHAAFR
jgi:hypothetical protein